ncbi:hypothetical protein RB195_011324 [Necator americanus]|uniref:Uncharacterized protein n=1 Tax=Necator americanus TaxID=51031 RepID=A0ABR1D3P9_NECAM
MKKEVERSEFLADPSVGLHRAVRSLARSLAPSSQSVAFDLTLSEGKRLIPVNKKENTGNIDFQRSRKYGFPSVEAKEKRKREKLSSK